LKGTLTVTSEQAAYGEEKTRDQAKSRTWKRLRTGRVTASKAHQVCHTDENRPSLSLIKEICHPEMCNVQTAAMKWGIQKEPIALDNYEAWGKGKHQDFEYKRCGAFIHPKYPFLAASPDAIRTCGCHDRGCVEVKCPASKAKLTIPECVQRPGFCLIKHGTGYQLDRKHPYYSQVQLQLFVTDTEFCDFVVWTEAAVFVQTVHFNKDFVREMLPKMDHFFITGILPELVGRCFSRTQPCHSQSQALPQDETDSNVGQHETESLQPPTQSQNEEVYCTCNRGEDEDDMVACDNKDCSIEWFHFFCVGIKSKPKGRWYCPECRKLPQFRMGGKTQRK